jgi:6-phosphofructokinase 2
MSVIITLTMNPAIDKSARVERVRHDTKLRLADVRRDPGGGGINVSRAIAHIGGASRAVFVVGGIEGRLLGELLRDESFDQEPIEIAGSIRENLTVVEGSTGEQYRFGMPGPTLTPNETARAESVIKGRVAAESIVVASGSLPPGVPDDFYARIARIASEAGARFIVDTSGKPLAAALEEGVWLVKPNLNELASLLKSERLEEPEIRDAAGELVAAGRAEHVVVSLGSGGAYLVGDDEVVKRVAPTVAVESRIGAGDSMVGGMAFALARGASVGEAVRWGVAAGAAAVMTPGTELCRGDDVRRLLDEVM